MYIIVTDCVCVHVCALPETTAEVGTIAGIVSAVAMALVGAVSSYISYQKKKLCFGIQRKAFTHQSLHCQMSQYIVKRVSILSEESCLFICICLFMLINMLLCCDREPEC